MPSEPHWTRIGFPIVFVIGAAALTIRALLDSKFGHGTLLYLLVPFAISIALYYLTRESGRPGLGWRYLNQLRFATIVFLVTSALLFEGFICMLMFMPIYYVLVSLGYLASWFAERRDGGGRVGAVAIPTVVLALSAEGLLPATTIPRDRTAIFVTRVPQDTRTLQRNMAEPIAFPTQRHWFLHVFPLPDRVQAGSLRAGDVHRLHFTYKKWFFANYQEGEMDIRIADVTSRHIRTEIVRNTSSHYMRIDGTDVRFDPLPDGGTRLSLTVRYSRLLDPAWYFGPMEQLAARQSARYLIETIIARQPVKEESDG